MPFSSVLISRIRPMLVFLSVTLAPETAELFWSVTIPSMVAVAACCPKTETARTTANAEAIIVVKILNRGCLRNVIGFPLVDVHGYDRLAACCSAVDGV